MQVIDPGHSYELRTLDGLALCQLVFVKREGLAYPGNVGHYPGTTCQEVIRALIDRMNYLDCQHSCWHNKLIMALLCCVIWLFEHRHARRQKRHLMILPWDILQEPVCSECGHIRCLEHIVQ